MEPELGIAVVGCGRISESHIAAVRASGRRTRLVAVVDTDRERAEETGKPHGVLAFTSLDRALEEPAVQAVVVCTPHADHRRSVLAAAERGRHVLVEKPFALDLDSASDMVAACDRDRVTLMAAQTRRYYPAVQAARARLSEVGRITQIVYTFTTSFDHRSLPAWWDSPEETGGLILPMMGSHSLDLSLWLLGDQMPESVYAVGAAHGGDGRGLDECAVTMRFGDGTLATSALSLNAGHYTHECVVVGTEGTIRIHHPRPGVALGDDPTDLFVDGELVAGDPEPASPFTLQMEEFAGAIRKGREPLSSGRRVLPQLAVIDAARRSVLEQRPVRPAMPA